MFKLLLPIGALALLLNTAGPARAESETADANANCNAAFLRDCGAGPADQAPLPLAGLPAALALLVGAGLMLRRKAGSAAA